MKQRLVAGIISSLVLLSIAPSAMALTIDQDNAGGVYDQSTPKTYFFPIVDATGKCNNARVYPPDLAALDTSADADTGPIFNITPEKTRQDIIGSGITDDATSVSVYAEVEKNTNTAVTIFNPDGTTYTRNTDTYYIEYPMTDKQEIRIGLRLRARGGTNTSTTAGLCALAGTLTPGGNVPSFCAPATPAGSLERLKVKIGLTSTHGNVFSGFTTSADTAEVQLVFASCPPNTNAAGPQAPDTATPPIPLQMTAVPGDQQIRILNSTAVPTDSADVVGVVVYADTASSLTYDSSNSQGLLKFFGSTTGTYKFDGLRNNQQYYFSLGWVNRAGLVSTGTGWGASTMNYGTYGTPLEIAGFLDHSTCFVATAAYGTEFDERLPTLRAFRDQILLKNTAGRAFVSWYYSWSPRAAMWLTDKPVYRALVRFALAPVVELAQAALWLKTNLWVMTILMVLGTAATVVANTRRSKRGQQA